MKPDKSPSSWWQGVRIVLLTAAVLLPLQPLLTGHLPWQGDGLLHFYRLGALANAIDWGWLYPRWLPDLGLGGGFPLFNYYAPLSTYLVLPFYLLGSTAGLALRLSYGLALLLLLGSVWGWSKRLGWGSWGVLIATAPYVAINLYQRAALAELWGMATFALALWQLHRLALRPTPQRLLTATGAFAALMVAHNITALIGTPFLLGLVAVTPATAGQDRPWLLRWGWFPLGLALTAFFWVPAVFESDLVQIGRLTNSSNFSYVNHFMSIFEWLSWPPPADPDLINPPLPLGIGWVQGVLGVLGVVSREKGAGRREKGLVVGLGVTVALCLWLTMPLSQLLWEWVPGLPLVQFPWRFLGPAAIFLALLNARALQTLWHSEHGWLRAAALLLPLVMIAQQLPYLFPPAQPVVPERITSTDLHQFEQETGWFGTTSAADYLPVGVTQLPTAPLHPAAFNGRTAAFTPSTTGQPLILPQFDFPGWRVEADGRSIPRAAAPDSGLIVIRPPADSQTITLTYVGTLLEQVASWVSAATFLGLCGLAGLSIAATPTRSRSTHRSGRWQAPLLVVTSAILIVGVKTFVLDTTNHPWRQSRFDGSAVADIPPADVNFDNRLQLIGVAGIPDALPANAPLEIELYWQGLAFDQELSVGVQLFDPFGIRVAQNDAFHPADFPLPRWRPGQYARDRHHLQLPAGAPPGDYALRLVVYDQRGQQKAWLDRSGRPLGIDYPLATLPITPAGRPPTAADLTPPSPLNQPLTDTITLLGLDPLPATAQAGETVIMSTYWSVDTPPIQPFIGQIELLDAQNTVWQTTPLIDTPGPDWRPGESRFTRAAVRIPAAAPAGPYTLALDGLTLATLTVDAPLRLYQLPPFDLPLEQPVGDAAVLRGATVDCPLNDDSCLVALVWEAAATPDRPLTVFVQLLGPDGRPVAQSDQTPRHVGVDRPTTGWLPGEFLLDEHRLTLPPDLPPAPYQLIVGLYDPASGLRLPTAEGDVVTIPWNE